MTSFVFSPSKLLNVSYSSYLDINFSIQIHLSMDGKKRRRPKLSFRPCFHQTSLLHQRFLRWYLSNAHQKNRVRGANVLVQELNFLAVNFVRVILLNAKINGPLEKAVMKRTMEVVTVTVIESEVCDKDISVQYRHCGDIVYIFLLVFLSYDFDKFAANWQPLWNLAKISEFSRVTKWHAIDFQ